MIRPDQRRKSIAAGPFACTLLISWAHSVTGTALAADWTGQPLAKALDDLRRPGFSVIFSSELVPDSLRVAAEPQTGRSRRSGPPAAAAPRAGPEADRSGLVRRGAASQSRRRRRPQQADGAMSAAATAGAGRGRRQPLHAGAVRWRLDAPRRRRSRGTAQVCGRPLARRGPASRRDEQRRDVAAQHPRERRRRVAAVGRRFPAAPRRSICRRCKVPSASSTPP